MDIFCLAPEEPFHVAREVQLQFPLFQLRKLDNFCIIFVIKGTACIEVDFRRFEIEEKKSVDIMWEYVFPMFGNQ